MLSNIMHNLNKSMVELYNYSLSNISGLLIILFLLIIFTVVIFFCYHRFIKPKFYKGHVLNNEFPLQNEDPDNDVLIIYFYTEWCPYCKKARPEWEKFELYVNGINNNNEEYQVKLVSIDCDKKSEIAEKYDVKGYPTIKLIHKGEVYDYDAKPEKENLVKFLESVTQ